MSRSRYKIGENGYPYFLTCTVVGWLPVFTRPETVEVLFESWRFLQASKRLTLFAYIVMENHLHLIASAEELAKEIGDFKSYTARRIIDLLKERNVQMLLNQMQSHMLEHKSDRDYQLWQEGSHPQQIGSDEMMRQKLEYIHYNPVKRGYVDEPEHWRYSSARNYARRPALIEITTDW